MDTRQTAVAFSSHRFTEVYDQLANAVRFWSSRAKRRSRARRM